MACSPIRLEDAGMHPMMLDMVKWHGAEEVEHRNVAFDAYMYVDGSYARRVRTALLASFTLFVLFIASMNYLFRQDPSTTKGRLWPLQLISATRRGLVPNMKFLITEILRICGRASILPRSGTWTSPCVTSLARLLPIVLPKRAQDELRRLPTVPTTHPTSHRPGR
ncbi:unnamed protein product, partial [Mesorhabditis spiculigera]